MKRISLLLLAVLAVTTCRLAPDGELYLRYDASFDTTVVNSLTDNNPATPNGLSVGAFYKTDAGMYIVDYDLDWLGVLESGSYVYEITAEDEDYIHFVGGIWTPGEDKYYTVHLFSDEPWVSLSQYPY